MSQIAEALRKAAGKSGNTSLLDLITSKEKQLEIEEVQKQDRAQAKKAAQQNQKDQTDKTKRPVNSKDKPHTPNSNKKTFKKSVKPTATQKSQPQAKQ